MVLTLHGNIHSTCTSRVRTVLEELNVPYEFVGVDFAKGEHKAPAFVAVQPFGQVPYLDDDGFKVFESRAIARYIALKHGGVGTLIPAQADAQKTALFEQAASIEVSNFDPSAAGLAFENIFKVYVFTLFRAVVSGRFDADRDGGVCRMHGGKTDPATVERLKTTLEAKLAAYDVILGKTKFLAGDEVTLADLFHLPYGALLEKQGIDFLVSGKFPNVTRWWTEITSRPSWKKVTSPA
ncbi:Glutathione S-transferase [Trametes pubescens]|uniref:glutathione transferase n=1 Tax=Trametes pubescens TaxID=154538 RepID=A0A1M2VLW9_TRAPU|nr:Glutathione S-transferase [Trametes pubescens]